MSNTYNLALRQWTVRTYRFIWPELWSKNGFKERSKRNGTEWHWGINGL